MDYEEVSDRLTALSDVLESQAKYIAGVAESLDYALKGMQALCDEVEKIDLRLRMIESQDAAAEHAFGAYTLSS